MSYDGFMSCDDMVYDDIVYDEHVVCDDIGYDERLVYDGRVSFYDTMTPVALFVLHFISGKNTNISLIFVILSPQNL